MATFKALVLPTNKRMDNTWNVKIRITHNRKSRYLPTPFFVDKSQITKGYKIKDVYILDKVQEKIAEMRKKIDELGFVAMECDINSLIDYINKTNDVNFDDYVQKLINGYMLEPNRVGTAKAMQVALNSLLRYNNGNHIPFAIMTRQFMKDYVSSLNVSKVAIKSYIGVLKSCYNQAIKDLNNEEMGVVIVKYRCFDDINIEKEPTSNVRAFSSINEMQAVIDLPYSGIWSEDFAKDMFVFSFVCFGINFADILRLKKSDITDGILTFKRKKIERRKGDDSMLKIKLCDIAKQIISKYNTSDDWLISTGRFARNQYAVREMPKVINIALKDITPKNVREKYVWYSARHSMASFLINDCGVERTIVHQMLAHSLNEFKMTDVYIRRDFKPLWAANERLIALFDWSSYEAALHDEHFSLSSYTHFRHAALE